MCWYRQEAAVEATHYMKTRVDGCGGVIVVGTGNTRMLALQCDGSAFTHAGIHLGGDVGVHFTTPRTQQTLTALFIIHII